MAQVNFDGLVQDCIISITYALEIRQSCNEPSIWSFIIEVKDLPILQSQYHFNHSCWWLVDAKGQAINSCDIDLVWLEYANPCMARVWRLTIPARLGLKDKSIDGKHSII